LWRVARTVYRDVPRVRPRYCLCRLLLERRGAPVARGADRPRLPGTTHAAADSRRGAAREGGPGLTARQSLGTSRESCRKLAAMYKEGGCPRGNDAVGKTNDRCDPTMNDIFIDRTAPAPTRRPFLWGCAAGAAALGLARRNALAQAVEASGLGAAFKGIFHIGAAVSTFTLERQIEPELALLAREFTSLTPENCMKWQEIRPNNAEWRFGPADKLVEFGTANGMYLVGHTLVWHSQVPRNLFSDPSGAPLDRLALLARMEEHIDTLVGRYRGRIAAWDVVNEAINEGNGWRRSRWLEIIGEDFMEHAFRFAHAADPDARLLYNDYNMHNPRKRAFLLGVLRDYLDRGVPIH